MKKITYFIGNFLLMIIIFSSCANLSGDKNITEKETSRKKYGSTSGNLLAQGVLAQDKEWIYYSNSDDKGYIYRRKIDSSEEKN